MSNTFDWIEIRTSDIEKTAAFYQALFGWKITEKESSDGYDYWIFDTNGEPRMQNLRRGGIWARPVGELQGVFTFIVVEDIEAMLRRVVELGGKVVCDLSTAGSGYMSVISDPCDNVFGLYTENQPGYQRQEN